MKIFDNGIIRDMTPKEIEAAEQAQKEYERQERTRPLTDSEVFRLFAVQSINTLSVDNNTALRCLSYHPEWADLCAKSYTTDKKGFRFQHKGVLYETVQETFTFQSQWEPGSVGTASIFSKINWQHAGTVDDPIPVPDDVNTNAFTYIVGKIYDEDGTLWKCQRQGEADGTEHSFVYKPSQAVGYFVKVQ